MKPILRFHGAAYGVTGSCYELEAGARRLLVDCGLFQGSKSEKALNYGDFPFDPPSVDAVILTHAHIDHSGLLPKLVRHGFAGSIYCNERHHRSMFGDAARTRRTSRKWRSKTSTVEMHARSAAGFANLHDGGRDSLHDAVPLCRVRRLVDHRRWRARPLLECGHLLGSASVEIEIDEEHAGTRLRVLFSGDIGPGYKLLQTDPEGPSGVDYLICESTYGDRNRPEVTREERRRLLGQEVRRAAEATGPLIIPSFAVERDSGTAGRSLSAGQERRYPRCRPHLCRLAASHPRERHLRAPRRRNCRRPDPDASAELWKYPLHRDRGAEQGDQPSGRILRRHRGERHVRCGQDRHHLKANLWRRNAAVMMAGYQAQGSLGRVLLDGAARVRIQGEEINVKAHISQFDLYSGHADASELVSWVKKRLPIGQTVFLTHGEEDGLTGLRERLKAAFPESRVVLPLIDDAYELRPTGSRQVDLNRPCRIKPERVARLDCTMICPSS